MGKNTEGMVMKHYEVIFIDISKDLYSNIFSPDQYSQPKGIHFTPREDPDNFIIFVFKNDSKQLIWHILHTYI